MAVLALDPEPCVCPESKMVVRAYLGIALDQIRQGYLETLCPLCKKTFRYTVGDCFTLRNRNRIEAH